MLISTVETIMDRREKRKERVLCASEIAQSYTGLVQLGEGEEQRVKPKVSNISSS